MRRANLQRRATTAILAAGACATVAQAHPGPRVWLGSAGNQLATYSSNDDLNPSAFTLSRVFVGGMDEDSLTANGRLDEFPVAGTGVFATQFPGYQVRTDSSSGLSTGSNFSFNLGPLLVWDSTTNLFKPTWQMFGAGGSAPQMNESAGSASLSTARSVQTGFSFFSYNTAGDHAHLITTLLGNGTQTVDGPHAVYAVPMQLTGGGQATSLPYYVMFGRDLGVNDAVFQSARTALQSIVASNEGTWIVDVNEDWTSAGNWLANVPNSAGAIANFNGAITAPRTVTLNVPRTVGRITFDNLNRYTIAGAGSLNFAGGGTIDVVRGSHLIDVPIAWTSGALTKVGNSGTLEVRNMRGNDLNINAGTVVVRANGSTDGTSKLHAFSIAVAGTLDLTNNDLIVGPGTSKSQVQSFITAGRLRSSLATQATTLGVLSGAQYDTVGGNGTFSGQSYVAADTLVKFTYYGDTDFNGIVNFDDYARTDTGFNNAGNDWFHGDFDLNGVVNFDDYALIDLAFNTQGGSLRRAMSHLDGNGRSRDYGVDYAERFVNAVPEPSGIALVAALPLLTRRRRDQRRSR